MDVGEPESYTGSLIWTAGYLFTARAAWAAQAEWQRGCYLSAAFHRTTRSREYGALRWSHRDRGQEDYPRALDPSEAARVWNEGVTCFHALPSAIFWSGAAFEAARQHNCEPLSPYQRVSRVIGAVCKEIWALRRPWQRAALTRGSTRRAGSAGVGMVAHVP